MSFFMRDGNFISGNGLGTKLIGYPWHRSTVGHRPVQMSATSVDFAHVGAMINTSVVISIGLMCTGY